MAAIQLLRTLVNERLNAAAEEIFGVLTRTITQYEEEIHRQREMLNLVFKSEIKLLKGGDPLQLSTNGKEVPPEQERSGEERSSRQGQEERSTSLGQEERSSSLGQEERSSRQGQEERSSRQGQEVRSTSLGQEVRSTSLGQEERSSSLDQEERSSRQGQEVRSTSLGQEERSSSLGQEEPEPPQVKEEQEELWSGQEGEQLQGLEEADIIKFTSTPVPVKSDHDEEKPQSSWFNQTRTEENREAESLASISTEQMETEPDGEDCGISESASENDHGNDWNETMEPQSGLNTSKSKRTQNGKEQRSSPNRLKRSVESAHELKSSIHDLSRPCCKVCRKPFPNKVSLSRHIRNHASDCGLCGKHLEPGESLKLHRQAHSTCNVCGKIFTCIANLERHVVTHTGEKRFCCTVCGKGFSQKVDLKIHTITHTEEKPFSCMGCGKQFNRKAVLVRHMKTHTAEKPFSCIVCGETFRQKEHLQSHMLINTGGKPYTCSVCGEAFCHLETFNRHMCQAGVFSYHY